MWGAPAATTFANPNRDFEVPLGKTDSIQALEWAPRHNNFVIGGWDNKVRCFQVTVSAQGQAASGAKLLRENAMNGPVLDLAWRDDMNVFAGGCDKTATLWNLQTDQKQVVGQHASPVKSVNWIPSMNVLATGSWDKSIKYWNLGQPPTPVLEIPLPERLYSMDVDGQLMVAATADRQLLIFDLRNPKAPLRTMYSPLKCQTRVVKCFSESPGRSSGPGFGIGSIEGRCAIRHASKDHDINPYSFAFKCHRVQSSIHAVNSICFHPVHKDAFATAGADGGFVFWDKGRKKMLYDSQRLGQALTACRWNFDGSLFGYTCSYDWSMGSDYYNHLQDHNHVYIHHTLPGEVKSKRR